MTSAAGGGASMRVRAASGGTWPTTEITRRACSTSPPQASRSRWPCVESRSRSSSSASALRSIEAAWPAPIVLRESLIGNTAPFVSLLFCGLTKGSPRKEGTNVTKQEATKQSGRRQTRRLRLGGFHRVSDVGGRDDKLRSPEFAKAAVDRWLEHPDGAASAGATLVEWRVSLDSSGDKSDQDAELEALIVRVEAGELDGIVVAKLDRLSRLAPRRRLDLLERIGAERLFSATESNDVSTPEGQFVRELFFSLARMEWQRYANNWTTAKINAIERGVAIARDAAFGYRFDDLHRYVIEPAEAVVVVELFELRAAGGSWSELVEAFERMTGRETSRQTMSALVRSRVYLGEVAYGDELVNVDAHEAIVELDLFEAVQRVNAERAGDPQRKNRGHSGRSFSFLGGVAKCEGGRRRPTVTSATLIPSVRRRRRSSPPSSTPTSGASFSNGPASRPTSSSSSRRSSTLAAPGSSPRRGSRRRAGSPPSMSSTSSSSSRSAARPMRPAGRRGASSSSGARRSSRRSARRPSSSSSRRRSARPARTSRTGRSARYSGSRSPAASSSSAARRACRWRSGSSRSSSAARRRRRRRMRLSSSRTSRRSSGHLPVIGGLFLIREAHHFGGPPAASSPAASAAESRDLPASAPAET